MSQQYPQGPNQTQNPGGQQPGYQQPQYPGQPQPPAQVVYVERKKTHKFRNFVVLPFVGLIALIIIISAASSGGGGSDPTTANKSGSAPARNEPRPVQVGKAFTIGKHQLDAGWKLKYTEYIGTSLTGTVTNVSKSTSTAIFSVKFLKGSQVVGNMQCTSNELEPGQQEAVECLNTVDGAASLLGKGAYDKVTAEATF
ncbi:hypothetical protein ACQPYH_34030 [Kribbella sp. CA-245084]|uniref:hypothetical protein n=1 Tax=Kribbella sp. CA-245084 TaxID=3239940 RepID=UPI003D8B1E13